MKNYFQNILNLYESVFYRYPKANLDIKKEPPKKIAIFLYSSHGDIALASSFTQYIKRLYPDSKITFVTSKKCRYIASLNPNIDRIACVDFPRFWAYRKIEKLKNKFDYDLFLNASFYPNLRYLIPFMPLIEVPFFLFRQKPDRIPTPHLKLDFNINKTSEPYIVLNLEAGTLGWHKNMLNFPEIEKIKYEIIKRNPSIKFYINESHKHINFNPAKNVKIFRGNIENLLKLMAHANGVISIRNGLCDVMAASTNVPQFVIYPEGKFPDDNGIETIKWGNMNSLGYVADITETTINRNNLQSVNKNINKINNFMNYLHLSYV